MRTILSESELHRVVHYPAPEGPSERLIVTFAPRPEDYQIEGFGTRFALDRGYDTIYVAQTREAWHQGIDYEELAAQILPVAAGREIITYGNSVGGYAALYFGGILNAHILAMAPRNDLHPLTTNSAERSKRDFKHLKSLDDLPKSEHPPVILFDPHHSKDSRLTNRWAAATYTDAQLLPFYGAGHNVIGGLVHHKILRPLAENFFKGERPPARMNIWEEGSWRWHATLAYYAERFGDDQVALDHFLAAKEQQILASKEPNAHAFRGQKASINILMDIIRVARRLGLADIVGAEEAELNALNADLRDFKIERRRKKAEIMAQRSNPA